MKKQVGLATFAIASLLWVPSALAHAPTEGDNEYADGVTAPFRWDPANGVPNWFAGTYQAAAETSWDAGNNTDAPRFSWTGSGSTVYFRTNAQMANTTECPSTFWYACTDYTSGLWLYTVFNSDQNAGGSTPWYWCQDPGQPDSTCLHVGRIALHELGHAVGLSRQSNGDAHQPDSATSATSVMQLNPPKAPDSRYDDVFLGQCDLFELQREYDVAALSGSYATCTDHATGTAFTGGEIGVVATRTSPATVSLACAGTSTTVTGTVALSSGTGLGRLAGNALASRTVSIQWRPVGGTWVTFATATTNALGSYARAVSYPSEGIREIRAVFSDSAETPLDGGISGTTTVTWVDLC